MSSLHFSAYSFKSLPDHQELATRITEELYQDSRVSGVYLSGSFARGKPDKYSDLDFYIIVPEGKKQEIILSHRELFSKVGKIATLFPATHLDDPHQIIAFYKTSIPIHVDFNYKVLSEITVRPKDKHAVILFDRGGSLSKLKDSWQSLSETAKPTRDDLQYFEDRFWGWCWYAFSKIERGELWEARDTGEYLRNNVLIKLAYFLTELPYEGSRRLEQKLPKEMLDQLEEGLPVEHTREAYLLSLRKSIKMYQDLMQKIIEKEGLEIAEVDRNYFVMSFD